MVKSAKNTTCKGLIFNIQRFSIHDGPGIRDLIFFKGCPLSCKWCSNPESQDSFPEIAYSLDRCIGYIKCGQCSNVCEIKAINGSSEGKVKIDKTLCNNCGKCAEVCPAKAIKLFGQYVSVDEVVAIAEEDSAFYSRSGGGITVGGGEPLSQTDFVHELLKKCRDHGLDTAIETAGYGDWGAIQKACIYANLIFYDIKCMDSKKHKEFTGVSTELILENIKRLSISFPQKSIIVRTPIIPGFNDSVEEIQTIANFIRVMKNLKEYELIPYHGFGEAKYYQLGREYPFRGLKGPSQKRIKFLKSVAEKVLY